MRTTTGIYPVKEKFMKKEECRFNWIIRSSDMESASSTSITRSICLIRTYLYFFISIAYPICPNRLGYLRNLVQLLSYGQV